MRSTENPVTAIASGSELFLRFITLATLDTPVRILLYNLLGFLVSCQSFSLCFLLSYFTSTFKICSHIDRCSILFDISHLQNARVSCFIEGRCFMRN